MSPRDIATKALKLAEYALAIVTVASTFSILRACYSLWTRGEFADNDPVVVVAYVLATFGAMWFGGKRLFGGKA